MTDPTKPDYHHGFADGYAAAKRFYGDSAPIALDKIRVRLDQLRVEGRDPKRLVYSTSDFLQDLSAILDTATEQA